MSSNLAYLVYEAMTSKLNSVSFYAVDTKNNQYEFNVLVPSTNTYYYFDSSESEYTATSFVISVNDNAVLTVPLNNVQKTVNMTLIVLVTLDISILLPGVLVPLVTQAIQGLFAGVLLNLGCSVTANYTIINKQNGQSSSGSMSLPFVSAGNTEFTASNSISYSQHEQVYVTQVIISCSLGGVQEELPIPQISSGECTDSSGCTFTLTVTFSS